jgi:hypothetical protein
MTQHFIYVIGREEGPVKVGVSSYPAGRLSTIQTGCPFKIDILHLRECRDRQHALKHEGSFHRVYADERLSGEWFDLEADYAIECVDMGFEFEEYFEQEARRERMAAELNIWQ